MTTQPEGKLDPLLKKKGVSVLMVAGLSSTAMEAQVVRWREELKFPLDWSYVGGRAVVVCLPQHKADVARHIHAFSVQVMPL